MCENITKLLGQSILSKNGIVETSSLCSKKFIGLYYSSSWSSSCLAFTRELGQFYENFKINDQEKFEVVYISSDRDEKHFTEQYSKMPWLALPYSDRNRQMELTKQYRIRSIPSLVIIDSTSTDLITSCGRAWVQDDPSGLYFPWKRRDPIEVLNESVLVSSDGRQVSYKSLKSSYKGLYFSAHWCPPCKTFTPVLIKLYHKLKKSSKKLEVIFISSDRSSESFGKFFSMMPWLTVPYEEEKRRKELAHLYLVEGIPCLILLDESDSVITKEGRIEVIDDPNGEEFPWKPKLVDELSEKYVSKLNEEACVLFFISNEDKEMELAHYSLLPVAEEYEERTKRASIEDTKISKLNFFYSGDADICESVRELVSFGDDLPILAILDIPNGKKYVHEKKENITSDMIGKFVRDFLSQKLSATKIEH